MRLKLLNIGSKILSFFLFSSIFFTIFIICLWLKNYSLIQNSTDYIFFGVVVILSIFFEIFLFWIGIIIIYTTSIQLGFKYRILGIVCGCIPIINIYMLIKIIKTTTTEYKFEKEKMNINQSRKEKQICKTKYPILLVHGVFFRDFKHLNYWGRIPEELKKNGATIFYGNHNSAASVENSAKELEKRIKEIIKETNCEKVNIIAHSKGGLDARTAISKTSIAPYVASLTTINTPHRGCEFADYLLNKISKTQQLMIANQYNKAATKLGDINPDFLAAVYDLTFEKSKKRNEEVIDNSNVYYQSIGSKLNKATSGKFPLNFTYHLVEYFDGDNDGLVGEKSFKWGKNYKFLTCNGKRGISHADMIDLNRENIKEFDVREFYVQLVNDLREKGF